MYAQNVPGSKIYNINRISWRILMAAREMRLGIMLVAVGRSTKRGIWRICYRRLLGAGNIRSVRSVRSLRVPAVQAQEGSGLGKRGGSCDELLLLLLLLRVPLDI
jgi:hypothetical protein